MDSARVGASKRPEVRSARIAVAVALCASLASACGAGERLAPYTPPPPECPGIDDYLADVYAIVDEGGVEYLATTIRDRIPDSVRRDLVDALLRLLGAFPEGSFTALAAELDGLPDDEGPGLQRLLGRVVGFLATGAPVRSGPDLAFMGVIQTAAATCEGAPVFSLLASLLGDETLVPSLIAALASPELGGLLEGLELEGEGGRAAFQLLVRNLLVSASSPTFDVEGLVSLLAVVVGAETIASPPWDGLVAGVRRVFAAGDGLAQARSLLVCLGRVDPDRALGGFAYDLVTSGLLDELSGQAPGGTLELVASRPILDLAESALAFLASDPVSRRALRTTLVTLLDPALAPPVLEDLARLLDREALGGVIDLVVAVASKRCAPPARDLP